jgi:arginyl-tRNA synthetase
MIKIWLLARVAQAVEQAASQLNNLTVDDDIRNGFKLERPRNAEHGDYAVNVSFLARHTKMAPPAIAEILGKALESQLNPAELAVSVLGGNKAGSER